MVSHHKVEGYEAFKDLIQNIPPEKGVVLLFSGSTNESGQSWCPDCKEAEPVIESILKDVESKSFHFIHVLVGTREEWKNPKCPFRTDEKLKLTSVPTLMKWGDVQRLNDKECQDQENIRMLFEDLS